MCDHPLGKETLPNVKSEPPLTQLSTIPTLCSWEDPGNSRPGSLTSAPGKMMAKILLGATERHFQGDAIVRHSRRGFTKGEPCLTNLTSFYDKVTRLVGEGQAVDGALCSGDWACADRRCVSGFCPRESKSPDI